ncbi:hypothetical protein FHS15_004796 [Paenibacillus castaneae]|uniref:hypothetical protein n=1 Tax=Paenibacillus castaneae TaxID=474957 RepID=UPI00141BB385|nr:hypothetical protein [Paenibacillus castaneae]NIK79635.1 hypothetical protein [Paenibacillus castaneae]
MIRSKIQTLRYRVGKNSYLIILIHQSAAASAQQGNVLASNAVNILMHKKSARR